MYRCIMELILYKQILTGEVKTRMTYLSLNLRSYKNSNNNKHLIHFV